MAQVIAVHEIQQNIAPGKAKTATEAAVRPKSRTIAPGTLFHMPEGEELARLRRIGAVRDPRPGEFAPPPQLPPVESDAAVDAAAPAKRGRKPKAESLSEKSGENEDTSGVI